MQMKIMQDDGSPLAQIGASGGPLSKCVLQQKLIWAPSKLKFLNNHVQELYNIEPSRNIISMNIVIANISIIISVTINITSAHFLPVWICNISLLNFFIFEVRRGYRRVC